MELWIRSQDKEVLTRVVDGVLMKILQFLLANIKQKKEPLKY